MSDILKELYTQQIKNINFHSVAMQTYQLFGDFNKMKKIHRKKLGEEINNYFALLLDMTDRTRQLVNIPDIKFPAMEITERPPSRLKRIELHKSMLLSWEEWEESVLSLYSKAVEKYPHCVLLKSLVRDTENELKFIRKMLGCL